MKYAVVTGATKGIGRSIAETLLANDFYLIGNYAGDDEAAEKFLEGNSNFAPQITLIKQDLSSFESACKLSKAVIEITQSIDVLILNSGTTSPVPFGSISEMDWMRVINVNLNAPFFLIQRLSEYIATNRGRIILIGSAMGDHPHAKSIAYGVSKAAVHELARYLVKYFSPMGITVNAVAPGFIDTPWQAGKAPDHRERIERKIALHRFGDAGEVASLCMQIIENQYINGAVLSIDGGYSYQ